MSKQTKTVEALAHPFADWLDAHGIAKSTGYELVAKGELQTFKLGKRRYISAEAARQFFARAEAGKMAA